MSSFAYWTMTIILYQTIFSMILSWLILGCKLPPEESELHEVTLIKLLYLYDPESCGRIYFYNHTQASPAPSSKILWPVKNDVAASFRRKIRVWLYLHLIWTLLGVAYLTQGQRPCGFYAALLPFTLTGVAILIMDLTYATTFLLEAKYTGTEADILSYINADLESVRSVTKTLHHSMQTVIFTAQPSPDEDTSWISLVLAYISCRAVVQWFLNFWLVKDNYYEGLAYYNRLGKSRYCARKKLSFISQ